MKKECKNRISASLLLFTASLLLALLSNAQTLFVPTGTAGIGSSTTKNVGIGISNPASRFELQATSDALARFYTADTLARITFYYTPTTQIVSMYSYIWKVPQMGKIRLGSNKAQGSIFIDGSTGLAGVNTENPTANFTVKNTTGNATINFQNGGNTPYWITNRNDIFTLGGYSGIEPELGAININRTKKVGINCLPNSNYALTVNGTAHFGTVRWANSKLIGDQGGAIVLGDGTNAANTPYIDFKNGATSYDGRILLNKTGSLQI
ncbi:MAG: hypothetical protein SNJ71_05740 [Bacteroidales bacterium]